MTPTTIISLSSYAKHRGVSREAVSKAVAAGRLRECVVRVDGRPKIADVELADREWYKNTRPRADHPRRGSGQFAPRAAPRANRGGAQFVYFIQCATGPGTGPIKIGVAVDVSQRLAALQCASPFRLHVLATIPGGYEIESELHARLAAHHLLGEWFRDTADVRTAIWELAGV